jgi:hypothetical protein
MSTSVDAVLLPIAAQMDPSDPVAVSGDSVTRSRQCLNAKGSQAVVRPFRTSRVHYLELDELEWLREQLQAGERELDELHTAVAHPAGRPQTLGRRQLHEGEAR